MKPKPMLAAFAAAAIAFAPTFNAQAVMQSLNGQTGQTQTFANDTNITMSSSGNVHTLGWTGILQGSRGGTGIDLSSLTEGSILFYNGSNIAENTALFWDDTNNILQLGSDINFPASGGSPIERNIIVNPQTATNEGGDNLAIISGYGNGSGGGGTLNLRPGDGGEDGPGGAVFLKGGDAVNGEGGSVFIGAGESTDGGPGQLFISGATAASGNNNGGDITLRLGAASGAGTPGKLKIQALNNNYFSILNFDLINSSDKTFTFQDASGTLPLLESNQTFSGLNKFEGGSDTTIYVGSSSLTGCIAMGDSDGSGITYITANDGVLSATTSKPGICQ